MYFDLTFDSSFPKGNYYLDTFKKIPNVFQSQCAIHDGIIALLHSMNFEEFYVADSMNKKSGEIYFREKCYKKKDIMVFLSPFYEFEDEPTFTDTNVIKLENSYDVSIFYNKDSDITTIERIKNYCSKNIYKKPKGKRISLIIQKASGLGTKDITMKDVEMDISKNYGKDFVKVYEKIENKLLEDHSKGLVLFHGKPGTGKTTLIKHLINTVQKEVIFIPSHMVESISTPGFVPFLLDHANSILVIEDAERALLNRDGGESSTAAVSNILNMTDGTLDILNIQIIATFNTKKDNIDPALLRKGRLIAEWEFKDLSIDESNLLLKDLYPDNDYTTDKPLVLTDIYNFEEELIKIKKPETKIGFIR